MKNLDFLKHERPLAFLDALHPIIIDCLLLASFVDNRMLAPSYDLINAAKMNNPSQMLR